MSERRPTDSVEHTPSRADTPSRRHVIRQLAWAAATATLGGSLGACGGGGGSGATPATTGSQPLAQFKHGVASGDPLADRVILWTRLSPLSVFGGEIEVDWEVASDADFKVLVALGKTRTRPDQDYTVKVDVTGLSAATTYFYRFRSASQTSPAGRTKTLPTGTIDSVRLAVFSCANFPQGFFNVYDDASQRDDVDAAIHLGDYIYEFEKGFYEAATAAEMGRQVDPPHEIVSLKDYRLRHAQYKTDAQLQKLHARMPMIAVWDDHEFSDDTWMNGAANHDDATEGSFAARKAAAMQAYHEWMPTRVSTNPGIIYRSFAFGDLLALHMLDTRAVGRDRQIAYAPLLALPEAQFLPALQNAINDGKRELLGATQFAWLQKSLADSKALWQVLGQQVVMGRMHLPKPIVLGWLGKPGGVSASDYQRIAALAQTKPSQLSAADKALLAQPRIPYNLDAWDGYAAAREKVLQASLELKKNLVVLSGDTHNAWANVLKTDGGTAAGVEFATASVSSPGFDANTGIVPAELKSALESLLPDLRYCDTARRGYLLVTATRQACTSEWVQVSTVSSTSYSARVDASWRVVPSQLGGLVKA
ncbi:alkaline phosphatase D family protein [Diaphorobacter caeni]|uniref:alkaline phosphatase D family protein n=1 Tax=Diaphorobacter caeni TaxID=2784387 RepID=UPI00189012A1|nr:alkaline phosphatase D family protein [Diaphorobacter caeni]MBF5002947.1 alkaline phosphatase D family protein [Diaphorobacter caeni]